MPSSKRTRIQSKKKKRRFLMTSKKCWMMEDHLVPLYSHLVDCYSNQLLEDPFCGEIIQVKQETEVIDYLSTVRWAIFWNNGFLVVFPYETWYCISFKWVEVFIRCFSVFLISSTGSVQRSFVSKGSIPHLRKGMGVRTQKHMCFKPVVGWSTLLSPKPI